MSHAEKEHWNQAYTEGRSHSHFEGQRSHSVDWAAKKLNDCARVLDLGAGVLRNSRELAESGHEVLAVDIAQEAFNKASPWPESLQFLITDVDTWTPLPAAFDLVIMVHYLNREKLASLAESVGPGGLLAVEFRVHQEPEEDKPRPHFRLAPGEIDTLFPGFEILQREEPSAENHFAVAALLQRNEELTAGS